MPGWQLKEDANGVLRLRQEWKVRNFQAGLELFKRIGEVSEAEGHHPDLHLEGYNRVAAELSTHSVGTPLWHPYGKLRLLSPYDFGNVHSSVKRDPDWQYIMQVA